MVFELRLLFELDLVLTSASRLAIHAHGYGGVSSVHRIFLHFGPYISFSSALGGNRQRGGATRQVRRLYRLIDDKAFVYQALKTSLGARADLLPLRGAN